MSLCVCMHASACVCVYACARGPVCPPPPCQNSYLWRSCRNIPAERNMHYSDLSADAAAVSPLVTLMPSEGMKEVRGGREVGEVGGVKHQLSYSVFFYMRFMNKSQARPHNFAHTQCMRLNIYDASSECFCSSLHVFSHILCWSHNWAANTLLLQKINGFIISFLKTTDSINPVCFSNLFFLLSFKRDVTNNCRALYCLYVLLGAPLKRLTPGQWPNLPSQLVTFLSLGEWKRFLKGNAEFYLREY